MTAWRITLKVLQGVRGLLDLIVCEFLKLKRKKFVLLTILAASLFPIPSVLIMRNSDFDFNNMYSLMMLTGEFLLLPCVLVIMASMLFFNEKESDSLKNFLVMPVSNTKFVLSKIFVLIIFSVFYSFVATLATILGGVMIVNVNMILEKSFLSILIGLFVAIAVIPIVTIILFIAKNQMIACVLGCAYTIVNYLFVWNLGEISVYKLLLLPLAATYRFFLPHLAVVKTEYVLNASIKAMEYIPTIIVDGVLALILAVWAFKKRFVWRG